ncbi:hypothetical protein [Desulfonatronum thioautotrophicum]|nr:hypothetical protein [Desulfonatronum thioautotrophicum]
MIEITGCNMRASMALDLLKPLLDQGGHGSETVHASFRQAM